MDSRLLLFFVIACAVSRIDGQNVTAFTGNITRNGCGTTKLCLGTCDPSVNSTTSTCFFGSSQLQSNSTLFFELSGTTSGYVALGLGTVQSQGPSIVFVCGNNASSTSNSTFFFTPATNTSNGLSTSNVNISTVYSVQGAVTGNQTLNQTLVQCTFNTTSSLSVTKAAGINFFVYILNGTVSGNTLGFPFIQYSFPTQLDLSNPASNVPNTTNATTATTTAKPTSSGNALTNPLAHALAILLSAMGLLSLY